MKITKFLSRLAAAVIIAAAYTACKPEPTPGNGGGDNQEQEDPIPYPKGFSASSEKPNTEDPCTIFYRAAKGDPFVGWTEDLYVHIWIRNITGDVYVQSAWGENIDKLKMSPTEYTDVWKLEIGPSIREWFGVPADGEMSKIGVLARSADAKKQTKDSFISLDDPAGEFKPAEVVNEPLPASCSYGITELSPTSVCLALYDKDTEGKHYDHCFIVGDFNDWMVSNDYQAKRDEQKGCWWFVMDNIESGKEYRFQYHLLNNDGEGVRIFDPYTQICYDGDDHWIPETTYPGIPTWPVNTGGILGAFQTSRPEYQWKYDYQIPDGDNLVIYELHIRDFSKSGDLNGVMAKMDYLDNLGINAIELMPCQEFDGNSSWGYDPRAYFAMDKAYGTREQYKDFIDECHKRGIAVILDVVYNHTTGSHPYAKLYWNSEKNRTAANNPFYNEVATHPWSVFHDINHTNPVIKEHIKESLSFMLKEYHFDGFRFDLTKGFTQNKTTSDGACAKYDQSRIDILTEYYNHIKSVNPNAIMICEHLCEHAEEKALGERGLKTWRKDAINPFYQTAMGWLKDGDGFNWVWTGKDNRPFGTAVAYMESHDEERNAYKVTQWGNGDCKTDLGVRLDRLALNAAFMFSIPGPKMIWEFGELGYDVPLGTESTKLNKKPDPWEYYKDIEQRMSLYDRYAQVLNFRFSHPKLFTSDVTFTIQCESGKTQRNIYCTKGSEGFVLVGNFGTTAQDISTWPPFTGTWTDITTGQTYQINDTSNGNNCLTFTNAKQGEYHLLHNCK